MLEQGGRSGWKMGDTLFSILLLNYDNKMMPFTGSKGNATNIYLVAKQDILEKGEQQLLGSKIPAGF